MNGTQIPTPEPSLAAWSRLRTTLGEGFRARVSGVVRQQVSLLDADGRPVARIVPQGAAGAKLEAEGLPETVIEVGAVRHTVSTGGVVVLEAEGGAGGPFEVRCAGTGYEANLGLIRNSAVATGRGGEAVARVEGSLVGRGYAVRLCAGDVGALPVAVFLLDRLVTLRRRAFLTGAGRG